MNVFVGQAFLDDDVQHRVQQRDVGGRVELQVMRRVARDLRLARIEQNQFLAVADRVFHEGRRDRVIGGRVGTDDHEHLGMLDVLDLVRHRARADALEQRGDAGGVAQAGAVIDVVGAEAGTRTSFWNR